MANQQSIPQPDGQEEEKNAGRNCGEEYSRGNLLGPDQSRVPEGRHGTAPKISPQGITVSKPDITTWGQLDVVRCLGEELGADLNQTNLHENRPLIAAQRYQHEQVVYSL